MVTRGTQLQRARLSEGGTAGQRVLVDARRAQGETLAPVLLFAAGGGGGSGRRRRACLADAAARFASGPPSAPQKASKSASGGHQTRLGAGSSTSRVPSPTSRQADTRPALPPPPWSRRPKAPPGSPGNGVTARRAAHRHSASRRAPQGREANFVPNTMQTRIKQNQGVIKQAPAGKQVPLRPN